MSEKQNADDKDRPYLHDVDMWDQSCDDPNTVANMVRRYTAQWGLPREHPGHSLLDSKVSTERNHKT